VSPDKPVPWSGRPHDRRAVQAARALENTENAVYTHSLEATFRAECEMVDASAVTEVVKHSLELEMGLYKWAAEQAGTSAVMAELISDKLNVLKNTNSSRIARNFGR
jgi:hypothetical protein